MKMEKSEDFDRQCKICYQLYDFNHKTPIIFCPNGHLICKKCTDSLIKVKKHQQCPFCKIKISQGHSFQQILKCGKLINNYHSIKNTYEIKIAQYKIKQRQLQEHKKHIETYSSIVRQQNLELKQQNKHAWKIAQQLQEENRSLRNQVQSSLKQKEHISKMKNVNQQNMNLIIEKNYEIIRELKEERERIFQRLIDDHKNSIKHIREEQKLTTTKLNEENELKINKIKQENEQKIKQMKDDNDRIINEYIKVNNQMRMNLKQRQQVIDRVHEEKQALLQQKHLMSLQNITEQYYKNRRSNKLVEKIQDKGQDRQYQSPSSPQSSRNSEQTVSTKTSPISFDYFQPSKQLKLPNPINLLQINKQ